MEHHFQYKNYVKQETKVIFLQGDHKNNVASIKSKKNPYRNMFLSSMYYNT